MQMRRAARLRLFSIVQCTRGRDQSPAQQSQGFTLHSGDGPLLLGLVVLVLLGPGFKPRSFQGLVVCAAAREDLRSLLARHTLPV